MPVKIRLTRQGRKKKPYYHIVIADSRAPRDGRFIERIGMYNPNTNPATIEIDFDRALEWLQKGVQPTDTCRAILSYKGVLMKKHLLDGIKKNAFSEEEAEVRFNAWLKEKEEKIQTKKDKIAKGKDSEREKRLEIESKIREEKALQIARKNAELAEEAKKASEPEPSEGEEITSPVEDAGSEEVATDSVEAAGTEQPEVEKEETTDAGRKEPENTIEEKASESDKKEKEEVEDTKPKDSPEASEDKTSVSDEEVKTKKPKAKSETMEAGEDTDQEEENKKE